MCVCCVVVLVCCCSGEGWVVRAGEGRGERRKRGGEERVCCDEVR